MRFKGGCELLGPVDIAGLRDWIATIPFDEWPQQHRLEDGKIRPSMATDPEWHGFAREAGSVVDDVMGAHFEGLSAYQKMLSVVMPGHSIPPHRDEQSKSWLCRVHVPLTTNDRSKFIVAGKAHSLVPGLAYRVNTEAEHSVTNDGDTPRIHMMWDIGTA